MTVKAKANFLGFSASARMTVKTKADSLRE
jgi:hypothetical protein